MTRDHGSPADTLAIDALLTDLPFRAALRAAAPAHLVALADAMAAETREAMGEAGGSVADAAAADVPEWLRLGAVDAVRGFLDGSARTCLHSPGPSSFRPVLAAAWRPGLVVCAECSHLLAGRSQARDAACDRCGRVCAGVDAGDPVHALQLAVGALVYTAGACTDCVPTPGGDRR